jgi:hypothetical protein
MSRSCIVCKVVASQDVQLSYCATCRTALYCSSKCQREDWKQHKQICKLLNVGGDGAMQVQDDEHVKNCASVWQVFELSEKTIFGDMKQFYDLFKESTFEGSQAAARKMKKIAKRQTRLFREAYFSHSLPLLIRSQSEKLIWPSSPLLVMLQLVDPNFGVGSGLYEGVKGSTPLHLLAYLVDHNDCSTHENQSILAKQLIEHGANVNAATIPHGETPLHHACCSDITINLAFIQILLENGADPNAQDRWGQTPLMHSIMYAPGAAKIMVEWPKTDLHVTQKDGLTVANLVRSTIGNISEYVAALLPDDDSNDRVKCNVLLQQWREVEEMLDEKEALLENTQQTSPQEE